ncbi:hypothetical protein BH11MYX1_BH11MYX1_03500 [soil metagenome]
MAPARPLALDRMIREALARVGPIQGLEIVLAIDPEPILVTAQAERLAELLDRVVAGAIVAVRRSGQILIAVYPQEDFNNVRIELAHRVPLDPTVLAIVNECGGSARVESDATTLSFPRSR